jgi:biotin-(acetyl-CoA carboxylase) ligase
MLEYAIIGIGINLKKMPLPPELRDIAVSVEELTGHAPDPELLFRAIAGKLRSFDGRRKDEYLCRYRSLCVTLGKEVSVIENGASYPAIARSIDSHGRLAVDLADGSSKTVDCADVSIRPIK